MRVVEDPLNRETIQAITQLIVERFRAGTRQQRLHNHNRTSQEPV